MTYMLGIDIGTTFTAAALWREGRAETVPLGDRANTVPSVLFLRPDGTWLVGEAAERRAVGQPERVAREFKRRVGDPVPILLGDTAVSPQTLAGQMITWVVQRVTEREGASPSHVTLTCPATWVGFRRGLLAAAAGLEEDELVSEPVAAAIFYAAQERVDLGTLIGVYDLGGGTFDATVVHKTATGFELVGQPAGDDDLGGVDFDQLVIDHVGGAIGRQWTNLDMTDPAVLSALAQVRANAVEAKEALSSDLDAGISVILPGVSRQVRLTRAEFEERARPLLERTIVTFRRTVASAGIDPTQLHSVLLVGGASRMPLVSELIGNQLGVQVAIDAHPKFAVCLGAAMAAASHLDPSGPPMDGLLDWLPPPVALAPPVEVEPAASGTQPAVEVQPPPEPTPESESQPEPETEAQAAPEPEAQPAPAPKPEPEAKPSPEVEAEPEPEPETAAEAEPEQEAEPVAEAKLEEVEPAPPVTEPPTQTEPKFAAEEAPSLPEEARRDPAPASASTDGEAAVSVREMLAVPPPASPAVGEGEPVAVPPPPEPPPLTAPPSPKPRLAAVAAAGARWKHLERQRTLLVAALVVATLVATTAAVALSAGGRDNAASPPATSTTPATTGAATSTSTPLPQGTRGLILRDGFSNRANRWQTNTTAEGSSRYVAGAYRFHAAVPYVILQASPTVLTLTDHARRVRIDVDARRLAGAANGHYGIACRVVTDANNQAISLYKFIINDNGSFRVHKLLDQQRWVALRSGTRPRVVKPGQVNHLQAGCESDSAGQAVTLTLSANGHLLARVVDRRSPLPPHGRIGVLVETYQHAPLDVAFDEFAAYET
jgi:actin-like ATPase involved in cell morphogenesis